MAHVFTTRYTMYTIYLCLCLFMLHICLSHQKTPDPTSSCIKSHDHIYNGTILECSNCDLSPQDIPQLNFPNTTTLIISHNNIGTLQNESFLHFKGLKYLECVFCRLERLEKDALKDLEFLEALVLSNNFLKIIDHAFPAGFFHQVPHLKTLKIEFNGNGGQASNYSDFIDIFDSLPRLKHLAIDSFNDLRIGKEFTKLTNLNTLTVGCENLNAILDDSFEGFQDSNLKHFSLVNGNSIFIKTSYMAFQYLPNISSLSIDYVRLGNHNVLGMMKPLQGRKMDRIYFNWVKLNHQRGTEEKFKDSILTMNSMEFSHNICLSHFVWSNNFLIRVESGVFKSSIWNVCLKSLSFITGGSSTKANPLIYLDFVEMKELETLIIMERPADHDKNFWTKNEAKDKNIPIKSESEKETTSFFKMSQKRRSQIPTVCDDHYLIFVKNYFDKSGSYIVPDQFKTILPITTSKKMSNSLTQSRINPTFENKRIRIPPRLKTLIFDCNGEGEVQGDVSFSTNSLEFLSMRNDNGAGLTFNGRLLGLMHLVSIDFTNTRISGSPSFFKWFPSLKRLTLDKTEQNAEYFSQVAENVPSLEYFVISGNSLIRLPVKMFHQNMNLKYLSLASNRFSGIPFDLSLTPNLEILDLRGNSLAELSSQERQAIDDLTYNTNITILLSNNLLSCTCSALPFLKWLQTSNANFDENGNYTCLGENGKWTFTAFNADIAWFWRQCQGRYYFLLSLVLAAILVAFYPICYLAMMHKTHILSKMRQIVLPGFHLKARHDFTYDVFVGYADQDVEYVRNVLLRYLENRWHLKTFVHQRDMLQDPLLMLEALRDSWRCVLLITENFLNGYPMAHNVMKTASFFVTTANPRSILVMVEERVQHQIPDYILQVVDEDNIIVLPGLEDFLEYEAKETLKTRILL